MSEAHQNVTFYQKNGELFPVPEKPRWPRMVNPAVVADIERLVDTGLVNLDTFMAVAGAMRTLRTRLAKCTKIEQLTVRSSGITITADSSVADILLPSMRKAVGQFYHVFPEVKYKRAVVPTTFTGRQLDCSSILGLLAYPFSDLRDYPALTENMERMAGAYVGSVEAVQERVTFHISPVLHCIHYYLLVRLHKQKEQADWERRQQPEQEQVSAPDAKSVPLFNASSVAGMLSRSCVPMASKITPESK